MRPIHKGREPAALRQRKRTNAATPQNLLYGKAGFPMDEVRQALLREQLHLCAYTQKSLKTAEECAELGGNTGLSCHIEHLFPQARKVASEAIDYQNMLACFPPSQGSVACEYGAQAKGHYDPSGNPFVSPLRGDAHNHFRFNVDGTVEGLTDEGCATIKILNLNHPTLTNDRKATISGWMEPRTGRTISAAEARRIANDVQLPSQNHQLPAYCVAIAQVAERHALKEERRAKRMKAQR
jgi:uncharacterized protein (TIGR02646 family)